MDDNSSTVRDISKRYYIGFYKMTYHTSEISISPKKEFEKSQFIVLKDLSKASGYFSI